MSTPRSEQFLDRLKRLHSQATSFSGVVYRSSTPKYATETDLLTGEGSRREGGRWNPKGIAVVYCSLTPETAMAETLAHFRYYGIPVEDAMPRTFVAVDAELKIVLDLRIGAIRQRLQLSEERILSVDWRKEVAEGVAPVTHSLGVAANESGWEAMIVPSAVHSGGHNLVMFPDNLTITSRFTILHSGDLLA